MSYAEEACHGVFIEQIKLHDMALYWLVQGCVMATLI
jgi:hypothetical protein